MRLIHFSKDIITFGDENENYSFLNLARYKDFYETDKEQDWKLVEYHKRIKDNHEMKLSVYATINPNTTYSSITMGFDINNLIRRTLVFNKEGNLEKDFINFFNPTNSSEVEEYNSIVLPNIPIEDYLKEERSLYKNGNNGFRNIILPDSIVEDFLEQDKNKGNDLNTYGDNYNFFSFIVREYDYLEEKGFTKIK